MSKEKQGKLLPILETFNERESLFEAVALISSATVGAGVLGIPFAVAKVGIPIGLLYIVCVGLLMIGLNQLVGGIILRTKGDNQLVGLAKKYLGKPGELMMSLFVYSILFGALVVYIIGEGDALSSIFGGSNFWWSIGFFAVGSSLIYIGLNTVKKIEVLLGLGILTVVLIMAFVTTPHIDLTNIQYTNFADLLFPYGVLLFAFHGTTSIPEARKILNGDEKSFKHSIIISGLVSIIIYMLFAFVVVGVTGAGTTEIATIGLGNAIGKYMVILGNIFAVLAMGTSFLIIGLSLRDSLKWDYDLSNRAASLLVIGVPFVIFLLGLRGFIQAIDIVGGVFMSLEMALLVFIYWKAKQEGDLKPTKYKLHHTLLFAVVALLAFTVGAVYSAVKIF